MSAQSAPRRNWLVGILGFVGISALAGLLATVMVAPAVALTSVTASSAIGVFDDIPEYFAIDELPERNEIYAHSAGGWKLIATVFDQNREEVGYEDISKYVVDATVAGEDRRFYQHNGVDVFGTVRAAVGNLVAGGIESGASTITMQLVKQTNVQEAYELPTEEERQKAYDEAIATTFDRKIREMKIAIGLEKRYTKKEILTAYLNVAFFGAQTYGIEAAAQRFFGVSAKDLTLAQAASLIAIVQFPELRTLADPENFEANQNRRDVILEAMLEEGYITQAQYDEAVAIPVDEAFVANGQVPAQGCRTSPEVAARWFCDYVIKSVKDFEFLGATPQERQDNWARGGYQLYTTLDVDMTAAAQNELWTWTPPSEQAFQLGSAFVTVEPGTGKVRVMTQNKIFDDALEPADPVQSSAVNFSTTKSYGNSTGFPAGSTYKLFTLLQWMIAGHGVNEVVLGSEATIPASQFHDRCTGATADYKIVNDAHESGSYSVRAGSWASINGVFIRMATKLDLCDINQLAAKLGIKRGDEGTLTNNPSSVIGSGNELSPLSMATAYAAVSAGGKTCEPIIIEEYVDPEGERHPGQSPKCAQVIDPDVAYTAVDVLKGVMRGGGTATGSNPEDGVPIFGKTGTTDGWVHTWVATSTTTNTSVVWVGNISGFASLRDYYYNGVIGRLVRHEIMWRVMAQLNARYGGGDWPAPSGRYYTGGNSTVPNVAGIGLTFDAARQMLEALGFAVADGGDIDSDQPAGTIAAQDPAGDSTAPSGTTVTLYKSRQNMTVLPDVNGQAYGDAVATLSGAGYSSVSAVCDGGYALRGGPQAGDTVIGQNPGGGTLQVTGTPVTLTLDLRDPVRCDMPPAPTPTPGPPAP